MNISKTMFKAYSKCNRVYGCDEIYKKTTLSNQSLFEDEREEKLLSILETMYDSDTGEDLLNISSSASEALLPYYTKVEEVAMEKAEEIFSLKIHHDVDTKKQKSFSFSKDGHSFYCYLDGYSETGDTIYIFEVKATTTKKFMELGTKEKGEFYPVFERKGNIISLKKDYQEKAPLKKLNEQYKKLLDRYTSCGKYAYDIAVERYIIENAIKEKALNPENKKIKYYLTVLNSNYVFKGKYINNEAVYEKDPNGNEVVNFIDLDEVTLQYQKQIEKEAFDMTQNFSRPLQNPVFDKHCQFKSSSKCAFCKICFPDLFKHGNIYEYLSCEVFKDEENKKHPIADLINEGKTKLTDIPLSYLNTNQKIQRDCFDNNKVYLNLDKINKGLNEIKYPIYHLDFESFPCPLPRFKGENPYMQSLFQFSLHTEKAPFCCDIEKDHFSFLAKDFSDCREDLIKALIDKIDLSKGGSVLVYNASFEKTRINELARMFRDYKESLLNINNHIFDLLDIVKTNGKLYMGLGYDEEKAREINYYNNNLFGSYSIKKVLPIFSDLSYQDLEVKNGTEAINVYASYPLYSPQELEEKRRELEIYCRQDTWSMVVILWGLKKLGNKNKH